MNSSQRSGSWKFCWNSAPCSLAFFYILLKQLSNHQYEEYINCASLAAWYRLDSKKYAELEVSQWTGLKLVLYKGLGKANIFHQNISQSGWISYNFKIPKQSFPDSTGAFLSCTTTTEMNVTTTKMFMQAHQKFLLLNMVFGIPQSQLVTNPGPQTRYFSFSPFCILYLFPIHRLYVSQCWESGTASVSSHCRAWLGPEATMVMPLGNVFKKE